MGLVIYKWEALDRYSKRATGRFQVAKEINEIDALSLVKKMCRQYENDSNFHFTLLEIVRSSR